MFRKVPHTYVIVFSLIVMAAMATWLMPGGTYHEETKLLNGQEQTTMVYEQVENQPQTWEIFAAFFKGFEKQAGIIAFILLIGGAFWILNDSRAVDVGILSFLRFTRKLDKYRLIRGIGSNNIIMVMVMLMFSVFGAVFGMSEETIAFIVIIVPLAISMGYDSITGLAMVFVAAGLGFAGAVLNPFTIGIAQGLAELPLFSGFEYRLICWLIINLVGIAFILRYAARIKRHPEKSFVYKEDEYWRKKGASEDEKLNYQTTPMAWVTFAILSLILLFFSWFYPITTLKIGNHFEQSLPVIPVTTAVFIIISIFTLRKSAHFFVLTILMTTIVFLVVGVMGYGWYIMEIATLFFGMGIASGLAMNKSADNITKLFIEGAKDIMTAALVVGLAGGIIIILEEGQVIHTILHRLSQSMNDMGNVASVGIMYVIQTIINIVIPSGSAKAALTMPIMAPFSDLINLSRQATVMAFQFGDGFTNMITPTSPVLIGVLGVARIPYAKWVKWIAPLIAILVVLGFLLLIPTVTIPLNGF
jgi:uncharacterized ion transporter superfamily protein YfcC